MFSTVLVKELQSKRSRLASTRVASLLRNAPVSLACESDGLFLRSTFLNECRLHSIDILVNSRKCIASHHLFLALIQRFGAFLVFLLVFVDVNLFPFFPPLLSSFLGGIPSLKRAIQEGYVRRESIEAHSGLMTKAVPFEVGQGTGANSTFLDKKLLRQFCGIKARDLRSREQTHDIHFSSFECNKS